MKSTFPARAGNEVRTPVGHRVFSGQRGISLIGMLIVVVFLALVAIIVAKVLPTFVEYRAVQSAVRKAHDSGHNPVEIRQAFDRSAAIDNIDAVSSKDLDVNKVDDDYVIAYAYTKKISLFGPVSLVIDYAGSSKSL